MTLCPRERYTRGLHCHIIFVMQYQALQRHATSRNTVNKTFFQVALNRIGILWGVLGRFGWFCWWFCLVLIGFGWFWMDLGGSIF